MSVLVLVQGSVYLERCAVGGNNANRSCNTNVKSKDNAEADKVKLKLSRDFSHKPRGIRRPNTGEGHVQSKSGT